ncbi:hypothetical protein [Lacinutrix sp. MEBiC02404]
MTDTDPFLAADLMWYSLQKNMDNFVNSYGGASSIGESITDNRVDWQKVKDVLLGNRPISVFGCN